MRKVPVMADFELFPSVVSRVTDRRGGVRIFHGLDPKRTAHVVVDLQNGFMAPGQASAVASAIGTVAAVNRISEALRAAGGQVVYLQHTADTAAVESWRSFYDHFVSPERRAKMIEAFTPGSYGHRLWQGLDVMASDWVVCKSRFSAFIQGSSDLHEKLKARGVDTLIVTGTVTNVCCESTARDAMMLDYKVFFVADGCSSHHPQEQQATLSNMANIFADVVSTDEVVRLIGAGCHEHTQAAAE
jgi:ureidoacrylate peracid hydrolase